jgi:hypothetical protein
MHPIQLVVNACRCFRCDTPLINCRCQEPTVANATDGIPLDAGQLASFRGVTGTFTGDTPVDRATSELALAAFGAAMRGDSTGAALAHSRLAGTHTGLSQRARRQGNATSARQQATIARLHRQAQRLLEKGDTDAYGDASDADPDERLVGNTAGMNPVQAILARADDPGPTPPTLNDLLTGRRFAANMIPGGQESGSLADPEMAAKARRSRPDTAGGDEGSDEYGPPDLPDDDVEGLRRRLGLKGDGTQNRYDPEDEECDPEEDEDCDEYGRTSAAARRSGPKC